MNIKKTTIGLDEEFENLIMPMTNIDLHRIYMRIMTEKHATIRVWNDIVLCDSDAYKICRDNDYSVDIRCVQASDRDEALGYVCRHQLQRTDLTSEYRRFLIGKIYNLDKQNSDMLQTTRISIAVEIGKTYALSAGAVRKYGVYARAIDRLLEIVPETARYILQNKLRISQENTVVLARFPKEELLSIKSFLKEEDVESTTFWDIRNVIKWKQYSEHGNPLPKPQKKVEVQIKKMPVYDPDADLTSITYTIPSWIKALERVVEHTDIKAATQKGKKAFADQLYALDDQIMWILDKLEV